MLEQRLHRRLIRGQPLRLEVRAARPAAAAAVVGRPFVPIDAQPLEAVENRLQGLGHVPLGVGVVDPQQELPAVLPGKEPVEQRRADAADVQIAGGLGAKRVRTDMGGMRSAEFGMRNYSTCSYRCARRIRPGHAAGWPVTATTGGLVVTGIGGLMRTGRALVSDCPRMEKGR